MKVYFSGIAGTGIRPLAEVACKAGYQVFGSDLGERPEPDELAELGIEARYESQDGSFLREIYEREGIDWFVYTSALPEDHPELVLACELGVKVSKRDEFLATLIAEKNLKLVAIAGTHGKTTTTAMIVWALHELGKKIGYIVGTTLPWAISGDFTSEAEYFVYEADEYDRNFLSYQPWLSVVTVEDYDHPDIYPTEEDYHAAFAQFRTQSGRVIENVGEEASLTLAGELRRKDASLAAEAILAMYPDLDKSEVVDALNRFPGAGRRFEKVLDGLYSDYAHHPHEIKATLEMAKEMAKKDNLTGVVAVYQPHQNIRQTENRDGYREAFMAADKIFWLPTFLTREDPKLRIIEPEEFVASLENKDAAEAADLNEDLAEKIRQLLTENYLVILMSAGPADKWLRDNFSRR